MAENNKKRSGSRRAQPRRRKPGTRREAKRATVHLLWHTDEDGDAKLIGVYDKHSRASAAIERMRDKPGFKEKGGAFEIAGYELNKDHWTQGFARHEGFSLPAWFEAYGTGK